jgi:hypothetical protein
MTGVSVERGTTAKPPAAGGQPEQVVRIEALLRNRAFIEDYVRARDAWRDGNPAAFPLGTYWLRRFANVTVAET